MKKIYYVVEKQLEDVDGFEETTGWKNVCGYNIVGNEMVTLCDFDMHNEDATVPELMDNLPEEFQKENTEIHAVQL